MTLWVLFVEQCGGCAEMMEWIIAVGIILCTAWALVNPFAGLLGLMAVYVIRPGELYPMLAAMHPERVMAIVVFASLLINRGKLTFPPITRKVLVFWAAMLAAIPLAYWKTAATLTAIDFGVIVIYHVLIINLVNTKRRFRAFLLTFVGLMGWLTFSTLFQASHGQYEVRNGLDRAVGLTSSASDPNALGVTLVSGLPFVLLFCARGRMGTRLLASAVAAASVWTVVLSGSRTSFICFIFLCAAFVFTRKRGLIYLPLVIVLLVGLWSVMPAEYQQRYLSIRDTANDESYQNRVRSWHAGWEMFKDHPLTGVGAGVFATANGSQYFPARVKLWMQPHNLYVQVMAELGLVGIVAFAVFLGSLIALNLRLRRQVRTAADEPPWYRHFPSACLFSLAVLAVAGYSGHSLYRDTWYMLAALAGALSILMEQASQLTKVPVNVSEKDVHGPAVYGWEIEDARHA